MGSWRVGLYSGDFALDLRSAIRAVSRLPFDGERLADILCENEPALNPQDDEHSTFWLVVADQWTRRRSTEFSLVSRPGTWAAVDDVSIANRMHASPARRSAIRMAELARA